MFRLQAYRAGGNHSDMLALRSNAFIQLDMKGHIVHVAPQLAHRYCYTPEHMIGSANSKFVDPADHVRGVPARSFPGALR